MKIRFTLLLIICLMLSGKSLLAQAQAEIDSGFEWYTLEEAQNKAEATGKKILLFGYAEWCTYCLKTRKETFPDENVLSSIKEYYLPVQLDAESEEEVKFNDEIVKETQLARYLRLSSYPTHYFIDAQGNIIGAQPGFIEPDIYAPLLNYVGTDAYSNMSFEEFIESEN